MDEKYILNIPIYVCSPEEYEMKREKYFNKQLIKYSVKKDKDSIENFRHVFYKYHWRSWKYNQVIGFIEIYIWGSDIRGDLYLDNSGRISIHNKKRCYLFQGKAFEMGVYHRRQSYNIFETLSLKMKNLKKERIFNKYFIDFEEFYRIGPYINWKKLLGY